MFAGFRNVHGCCEGLQELCILFGLFKDRVQEFDRERFV